MKLHALSKMVIIAFVYLFAFIIIVVIQFPKNAKSSPVVESAKTSESAVVKKTQKAAKPIQFMSQAPIDAGLWAKDLQTWQDRVWRTLSGASFDSASATWSIDNSSAKLFRESYFIAYMAEALRRGKIEDAKFLSAVVVSEHASKLSWKSVPFLGKTGSALQSIEEVQLGELRSVEKLLHNKSIELFYRPNLVPFLLDQCTSAIAQEVLNAAAKTDFSKSNVTQAVRLIQAYIDYAEYIGVSDNPFASALSLVDSVIAPAIHKIDGSFFVQTDADGSCDTITGIEAGKALIRLSELSGKPIYTGIGQSLILSLIKLAYDDGSLPLSVKLGKSSITHNEQRLNIDILYPILAKSPYYPHVVSFYKQLGPGNWMWTCAPTVSVEASAEKRVFKVNYFVSVSHYIMLYGVKPFVKVQLYNIDYNMDSEFEMYNASGYYYSKNYGVMRVKMRHKSETELMSLFYQE